MRNLDIKRDSFQVAEGNNLGYGSLLLADIDISYFESSDGNESDSTTDPEHDLRINQARADSQKTRNGRSY